MITTQITSSPGNHLSKQELLATLHSNLGGRFSRQKIMVLIPDHTRSLPMPFLFRALVEIFHDALCLDFMVALGTHPALSPDALNALVGISAIERATTYKHIGLLNHIWDDPSALVEIGTLGVDEIKAIAGQYWHPSLPEQVEICINRSVLDYDHLVILGPTFPHEVAGFSGGAKYIFPGISGPAMIHTTHWLGALSGVLGTIGIKDTPVRKMINAATLCLGTPVTLIALVVEEHDLSAVFIGDIFEAWNAAADFSATRHIRWCKKPFQRVLSCAPAMYDELWTAAKAMYKLEPALASGGELILYAPHLDTVSRTHGRFIYEIGYHILPYFLANWERFQHYPLGVLAHSTHLRGSGVLEQGVEKPNVRLILSSRIPEQDCTRLNLGYLDPALVHTDEWQDRESEGILIVPSAGEILYKVGPGPDEGGQQVHGRK